MPDQNQPQASQPQPQPQQKTEAQKQEEMRLLQQLQKKQEEVQKRESLSLEGGQKQRVRVTFDHSDKDVKLVGGLQDADGNDVSNSSHDIDGGETREFEVGEGESLVIRRK